MLAFVRPSLVLVILFTLLTGLAYPLAVTGIGQALFPAQANGSRIENEGVTVGSALIGQNFARDDYFWPRPSATGPEPYNAGASSGANYGPTDGRLVARVAESVAATGLPTVPADAVTTSGSGLDPDISPADAALQIGRVAAARGIEATEITDLVARMTDQPLLAIFGEPRVNVLALNMALDREFPLAQ